MRGMVRVLPLQIKCSIKLKTLYITIYFSFNTVFCNSTFINYYLYNIDLVVLTFYKVLVIKVTLL
jgi:hypothetical protein